jgi:very-short-patch-repair endonuclease
MDGFDADRRRLAALVLVQHGVVTLRQVTDCGVGEKGVTGMVRRGELRRIHRGVYLVGQTWTRLTPYMAAALAGGPGATISHRSAIYLDQLLPCPARPGRIHITVPGRHRVGDGRLITHETTSLAAHEVREVDGIPVTAPIRTLVDFAGDDATDIELDRAVAEAFALGLTNRASMLRAMPRRPGSARLRALLDDPRGPRKTRSRPERHLLSRLRRAGAPEPLTNHKIGRWEVDFFWPEHRLVVEVDAYATHSSPWAVKRDRRKDAYLQERGLEVIRVMDDEIDDDAVFRIVRRLRQRRAVDDRGDVGRAAVRARRPA